MGSPEDCVSVSMPRKRKKTKEVKEGNHPGLTTGRPGSSYFDQYPADALFPPNAFPGCWTIAPTQGYGGTAPEPFLPLGKYHVSHPSPSVMPQSERMRIQMPHTPAYKSLVWGSRSVIGNASSTSSWIRSWQIAAVACCRTFLKMPWPEICNWR